MAFHDFRYDDHDLDRTTNYNYAGRPAKRAVSADPLPGWQAVGIAILGLLSIWAWQWL